VNAVPESIFLSLAPDTTLARAEPGTITVERSPYRMRLKLLDDGVVTALLRLASGRVGSCELDRIATGILPAADLPRLDQEVRRLSGKSLIHYSCMLAGQEVMQAVPTSGLARFRFSAFSESARLRLSRFAYMRRIGDDMVLESPTSYVRVTLRLPFLGELISAFSSARMLVEVNEIISGTDYATLRASTAFLFGVGVLAVADRRGETDEDRSPWATQREFHDVVLHGASRAGLTDRPLGGTYRFKGKITPEPAVKLAGSGRSVPLPKPDLNRVIEHDPPLGQVMERRSSLRKHGDRPITIEQLGEFLYRIGRVKAVTKADPRSARFYESSSRTYPSGGAVYDIELYVTVRECAGVQSGVYHYDPLGHRLVLVSDSDALMRKMMLNAYFASGRLAEPHTLITLASRFSRMSWKYESIAYSLTLKNVGVLYEAMYLSATAMNLAGCGLGSGDSELFSLITGLDPLVESSVGEFMLGARQERVQEAEAK
jgi:oxazoline/thiazoline dehydrogenase